MIGLFEGADAADALGRRGGGTADFLQKPMTNEALRESITRVVGQHEQPVERHMDRSTVTARLATLTERERQVMERLIAGKTNKNIAVKLGISQRTMEHHRHKVLRKMGVKSLAILVRMVGLQSGEDGGETGPGAPK